MARKVIWTQAAWNGLEEIADHIAKDSIHYAAAFVREVRDAARTLRRFARRGRIVPEFHNTNLRELFVRDYRLIYRVAPGEVFIVGFVHGARDLWALWNRER